MINQITLNLSFQNDFSLESFIVSKCNINAKNLIEKWPSEKIKNNILCIFGPKGCGKTHLAKIWAIKNNASYITKVNEAILYNKSINKFFIIEDLDRINNISENNLFHFLNILNESRSYLLITSTLDPNKIFWNLKDLSSRMKTILPISIDSPDEYLLTELMKKLFEDRQLVISDDLIHFSMKRIERTFSRIYDFVEIVDRLSLSKQKPLSLSLVKKVLKLIK